MASNPGGLFLTQNNSVGIIGGASAETTVDFINKLVKWSLKYEDGAVPYVLTSDPALCKQISSYERSYFQLNNMKTKHIKIDPIPIIENIKHKRMILENCGAQCIVMPCHVSHSWYDQISKGCSVPFLHMGECVAKELKVANYRALEAGKYLQIGVLGNSDVLEAGFYEQKLRNEGFEVVSLDRPTGEHTLVPAVEALSRKDLEGAQILYRIAIQTLLIRAVNAVILVTDDMRGVLPPRDPLLKKCIDPIDALVISTLRHLHSTQLLLEHTQKRQR